MQTIGVPTRCVVVLTTLVLTVFIAASPPAVQANGCTDDGGACDSSCTSGVTSENGLAWRGGTNASTGT